MNKLILVLICALTLIVGCNGSSGVKKKGSALETAVEEYVAALRWGRYQNAYDYHIDEDGSKPAFPRDKLEEIRVTGHAIFEKTVNEELTEATVKGELQYYNTEYGTIKKTPLDQIWWYEPESKQWFLKGKMPSFK